MQIQDLLPFWPDHRAYFVPWMRFQTEEGSTADGPLMRKGQARQEILVWTDQSKAQKAGQDVVDQTGGTLEIRTMDRKQLEKTCRLFDSWGTRVVAVVMK